jgi:hypothetical protein
MGITAKATRRKGLEAFGSLVDTAKQEFPKGKAVTGQMGVFRWLWEHFDIFLLGAVFIVIGLAGSWAFGLKEARDAARDAAREARRRDRKRKDDDAPD